MHSELPSSAAYLPAVQVVHTLAENAPALAEDLPAEHLLHWDASVATPARSLSPHVALMTPSIGHNVAASALDTVQQHIREISGWAFTQVDAAGLDRYVLHVARYCPG